MKPEHKALLDKHRQNYLAATLTQSFPAVSEGERRLFLEIARTFYPMYRANITGDCRTCGDWPRLFLYVYEQEAKTREVAQAPEGPSPSLALEELQTPARDPEPVFNPVPPEKKKPGRKPKNK